ncbi:TetR family transcriptional regulator, partial [Actinacidiphila glaucinigra]
AMAAGCLFDPQLISETFRNGVEGLLTTLTTNDSAQSATPAA